MITLRQGVLFLFGLVAVLGLRDSIVGGGAVDAAFSQVHGGVCTHNWTENLQGIEHCCCTGDSIFVKDLGGTGNDQSLQCTTNRDCNYPSNAVGCGG